MVELCQEPCFALEAVHTFLVACELLGKDFDSNVSAEFGIARAVNFSHPIRTDRLEDFVHADPATGRQRHAADRRGKGPALQGYRVVRVLSEMRCATVRLSTKQTP